ncbi:hypothetical protein, partial [Burkholderia contaminans]|uniref:hypothetical protein n=1 Tax=Burkholderia contaminans TaxID=488447 RepID=UPI0011CEF5BD
MNLEDAADSCLVELKYHDALSSYYQLDASNPRVAAKISFCEWAIGQYDEARHRLFGIENELDDDGVGLLSQLIASDRNYQRRDSDMEMIWPRLQSVISLDSVPLVAAEARSQDWWPGDSQDRAQRHREIERLLAIHPGSQLIRLAVLAGMQRSGLSVTEQYDLLHEVDYPVPIPRYLWETASVAVDAGKFDVALKCLNQLEIHQQRYLHPSRQLELNIALARCDIAVKTKVADAFLGFDRLLDDASLDSDDRRRIIRAALAAACYEAPDRVPALADRFLSALEVSEYGFTISTSEFFNESYPVNGPGWDTYGHTWPCGDLLSCRAILVDVPNDRARLFFRAAFVISEIDQQNDVVDGKPDFPPEFWDRVTDLLGDIAGHEQELDGRLLSLHTALHAHRHTPRWSEVGENWILSEWIAWQNGQGEDTSGWLTLHAVGREAKSIRPFAKGVIERLRNCAVSAPDCYDLVAELVDVLVELELHDEFYQLMEITAAGDDRADVQFFLGLAAQWKKQSAVARAAYQKVLEQAPRYSSAIFNSLLLCATPEDAPSLDLSKRPSSTVVQVVDRGDPRRYRMGSTR